MVEARKMSTIAWITLFLSLCFAQSAFAHGRIDEGLFLTFDEDNILQSLKSHRDIGHDEFVCEFYSHGDLKEQLFYRDRQLHGYARRYDDQGHLLVQMPFIQGRINGIVRRFYPNGKVKSEMAYEDELPHGLAKFYASDGTLVKTVNYVWGLPSELNMEFIQTH